MKDKTYDKHGISPCVILKNAYNFALSYVIRYLFTENCLNRINNIYDKQTLTSNLAIAAYGIGEILGMFL
jgi:hypothetical protein